MQVTDAIASCDWTMDEVSELHTDLSRAMKTEAAVMARLAPAAGEERRAA